MTDSKILSTKPLATIPKWIIISILVVSIIGFLDASYLTVKHYDGTGINCSLLNGCDTVTTSKYSVIGGIPISLIGALYYLVIFLLLIAYFDMKKIGFLRFVAQFSLAGFMASLGLVFLQFFIIQALCLYCMISAISSTIIFMLGLLLSRSLNIES